MISNEAGVGAMVSAVEAFFSDMSSNPRLIKKWENICEYGQIGQVALAFLKRVAVARHNKMSFHSFIEYSLKKKHLI